MPFLGVTEFRAQEERVWLWRTFGSVSSYGKLGAPVGANCFFARNPKTRQGLASVVSGFEVDAPIVGAPICKSLKQGLNLRQVTDAKLRRSIFFFLFPQFLGKPSLGQEGKGLCVFSN